MTRQNKAELVSEICQLAGVDDDYNGNGHLKRFQLEAIRDRLREFDQKGENQ